MLPSLISEEIAVRRSGRTYTTRAGPGFPHGGRGRPSDWATHLLTDCAGTWTDTSIDSHNCGGCGIQCTPKETCCDGECVPNQENCGSCGVACGPHERCCSSTGYIDPVYGQVGVLENFRCVDVFENASHCGECYNSCPVTYQNGRYHSCCHQGTCIDPRIFTFSPEHCGECRCNCVEECGKGWHCSEGNCCGPCTTWFGGLETSDLDWLGDIGSLGGALFGGAAGAGLGRLAGDWLSDRLRKSYPPGCYSCEELKEITGTNWGCCDERCINLDVEDGHCGNCGTDCRRPTYDHRSRHCERGRCVCPPGRHFCKDKEIRDAGICVDFNDRATCGDCDNPCTADSCCVNGACQRTTFETDPRHCGACNRPCPGGWACCNGICRDVDHESANCGYCGNRCDGGQVCCWGTCTDRQTDRNNCGQCDLSCAVFGGAEGRLDCCAGQCVDKRGDAANCGRCGRHCGAGEVCFQGNCTSVTSY